MARLRSTIESERHQSARYLVLSLLSAAEPLPLYVGDALWHPCEGDELGGALCRLSLVLCGAGAENGRGGESDHWYLSARRFGSSSAHIGNFCEKCTCFAFFV